MTDITDPAAPEPGSLADCAKRFDELERFGGRDRVILDDPFDAASDTPEMRAKLAFWSVETLRRPALDRGEFARLYENRWPTDDQPE